ncbi:phosphate transporter PHO1 homolog 10 [Cryptomeria japonica]|uniref:phosphate transporter PHO1 homolog 10 n=1 Tax=Cryptomeria japonica TaxID=3369 RepID=UPI0027DAB32E|nr:phosphate transporter PHO1 homolog 10 [Cryptomeria japonica]
MAQEGSLKGCLMELIMPFGRIGHFATKSRYDDSDKENIEIPYKNKPFNRIRNFSSKNKKILYAKGDVTDNNSEESIGGEEEVLFMATECTAKNQRDKDVILPELESENEVDLEGEIIYSLKEVKRLKWESFEQKDQATTLTNKISVLEPLVTNLTRQIEEHKRVEDDITTKLATKKESCLRLEVEIVGLKRKLETYDNTRLQDILSKQRKAKNISSLGFEVGQSSNVNNNKTPYDIFRSKFQDIEITRRRASPSYLDIVEKSYLISSEEVNKLLERVEETFTKHFASGNHNKAVKILRPTRKKQRHRLAFFIGFFTGCSIALLVALILLIVTRNVYNHNEATRYMESVFPLYSLLGFVFLHMFMYAADLYFWRLLRINYPFIFGFKPGTELGFRNVFLITTVLSVMSLAGAISSVMSLSGDKDANSHPSTAEFVPLILVVILLVALFLPFKGFYYSNRLLFLRSALHCICAPFYKVLLLDFFLADQLTSQVQAIRIFEYFICYYSSGGFKIRSNKSCELKSNNAYTTFYFILAVVPYWIRFLQCVRRLVEERDAMQGYNALKYFSTIVAVVMRTAYSQTKREGWRIMSFFMSSIAAVVSTYWDLVIDWGLLNRNSQHPWLRDKLIIEQKSIYFMAMILNVLLRFAWIQSVMNFNIKSLHLNGTIAIFACLEIIRRGIWNFFRLENEHLNNVGKYRAFKSVPLPFQHVDDENDE